MHSTVKKVLKYAGRRCICSSLYVCTVPIIMFVKWKKDSSPSSLFQRCSCVLRLNSIVDILSASVIPGDVITAPIVLITVTKMHAVFDS